MISHRLEVIINHAIKRANELSHEYLTLEGIFLAMLEDGQVLEVLEKCGAKLDEMKNELKHFLEDNSNFSILSKDQILELGKTQFVDEDLRSLASQNGIYYQPEISLSLQRVIQRAALHVQSSGKKNIRGINLLVSLFQEKESFTVYTLLKHGVKKFDVIEEIAHGQDKAITGEQPSTLIGHMSGEQKQENEQKNQNEFLSEYTINLNELAIANKLDPIIGRQDELTEIIQTLCRRRKNNPLLVGDAGVGKTAVVEGLAQAIVENKVPTLISNTIIYSLDMTAVLAGAKFRGDFEQRFKSILKELDQNEEKGQKSILFIDEMHTLIGAGATGNGGLDAANLLKPVLTSGNIKVLGCTTHEEFRKFIEKNSGFSRRFHKIDIEAPNLDETFKIIKGIKHKFEKFHAVRFSNKILKYAVDLSEKYISNRQNPDKVIDVIDEVGAYLQIKLGEDEKYKDKIHQVTKKHIDEIIAKMAKIPKPTVEGDETLKLIGLKERLKRVLYGQDEAVDLVADAIILSRSGLGEDVRPIGQFVFAGPTGVGKTELARQLAFHLGGHLIRFDMSEYMEKHSIAKLIGAPPGYVGHDQGGLLTDAIKKQPHCVLLLDEIEKAHVDILNILLQIMDNGKLTDSQGRETDFKQVVLIMTSNAGAAEYDSGQISLSSAQSGSSKRDKAIKSFFSPEFRNRLDAIVYFNKLGVEQITKIVDKLIFQLESKLVLKKIEIEFSDDAKNWLIEKGYDPKMGARPMARLIDNEIKKPLSREILFGALKKGGLVKVSLDQSLSKLKLDFSN